MTGREGVRAEVSGEDGAGELSVAEGAVGGTALVVVSEDNVR